MYCDIHNHDEYIHDLFDFYTWEYYNYTNVFIIKQE